MGRPYNNELAELPTTYKWAQSVDVHELTTALASVRRYPLVAVGSGGSLSVATLAAFLHERATGKPARAVTPLELAATSVNLREAAILLLTARGTNVDILNAFASAAHQEAAECIVLTFNANGPLFSRATEFDFVQLPRFVPPIAKDGYLATNSLLAMSVLLTRAYVPTQAEELPPTFKQLLPNIAKLPEEMWRRPTLVALHGIATRAAAVDLESKFAESALANVHVVDFRNFAHGRHLWLARRPSETLIVSFSAPADRALAKATLHLVPKPIPRLEIDVDGIPEVAALRALITPTLLAAEAGNAHGVDVGRPAVPAFGRRMYHLGRSRKRVPIAFRFIERKARQRWEKLQAEGTLDAWIAALRTFQKLLARSRFSGLVLDYDGTICTSAERYTGCREEITRELQRLLNAGLVVGIATGRGKSVRADLQKKLSHDVWPRVLVGYYNGGDIAPLDDNSRPVVVGNTSPALAAIHAELKLRDVAKVAAITVRPRQITLEVETDSSLFAIWDTVAQVVLTRPETGITTVRSTHSIDILDQGVNKLAVVTAVQNLVGDKKAEVLAIGDQGRWPGNDSVLLQEPLALSVDESSADVRTCWNLAPLGYRQAQATLYYLRAMEASAGRARLRLLNGGRER